MIDFCGVTKHFEDVRALHDVTFHIERGEVFGLVGADGAGKTTLLRILLGLLRPDAGEVRVAGGAPGSVPVGYVAQQFSLYPTLTARENMELMGQLYGLSAGKAAERARLLLDFVGLTAAADRQAGGFSGGMKQKLALAAAWTHEPDCLVLDEPTTGVDAISRREFWQLLYRTQEAGATVVIATPYLEEAAYCHRLTFLDRGEALAVGTPAEIAAYGGEDATLAGAFRALHREDEE